MMATGTINKGLQRCTSNTHIQHEDGRICVEAGKHHKQ
uniref:Uncharacterized protein n=1 Tax=Rhizophora mucronata TaxID=61149 RepID=A0A2P2L1J6_RHIMU